MCDSADKLRCAVLTPAGMGAVAVVRIAGSSAWDLVRGTLRGRHRPIPDWPRPGHLQYAEIIDGEEVLDDVLVAVSASAVPGEQVVDVSCHGGRRVVERAVLRFVALGATIVSPDALSDAALGGASLIEREADDLLALASTRRGAAFLLAQKRLLTESLKRAAALAETDATAAAEDLRVLLARSDSAEFFWRPARVVLVGAVNAGKSSLANLLAGRSGAVVADRAGTTRDWVTIDTAFDGIPVTIYDTAGARATDEDLEREAIRRGAAHAAGADVVVVVVDAATLESAPANEGLLRSWVPAGARRIVAALNKIDLCDTAAITVAGWTTVRVSARTGDGIEGLRQAVTASLGLDRAGESAVNSRRGTHRECRAMAFGPRTRSALERILDTESASSERLAAAIRALLSAMTPDGSGRSA